MAACCDCDDKIPIGSSAQFVSSSSSSPPFEPSTKQETVAAAATLGKHGRVHIVFTSRSKLKLPTALSNLPSTLCANHRRTGGRRLFLFEFRLNMLPLNGQIKCLCTSKSLGLLSRQGPHRDTVPLLRWPNYMHRTPFELAHHLRWQDQFYEGEKKKLSISVIISLLVFTGLTGTSCKVLIALN